jgi:tripartite ATP-independent transporter DctM subunit
MQEALILIFVMLTTTLVGLPVGFALAASSILLMILAGIPIQLFATKFLHSLNSFTLLALPFFILTGQLMNTGGITRKIFDFADDLVGPIRGGLAQVNIVASMIFAGISGAAVADAAGLGTVEIDAMTKRGYDKDISVAVTAASATVGPIIPPSIILVVIGIAGEYSIGGLLVGGLVPGVLMGFLMMVLTYFLAKGRNYPVSNRPPVRKIVKDFKSAGFALGAPFIIVGGVMSGIFTATESGAIAAAYSFIVGAFIFKELNARLLIQSLIETAKMTAMILFLLSTAYVFGWLLSYHQVPLHVTNFLTSISPNKYLILVGVCILYLILGTIMEAAAIVVMTLPVLSPALLRIGVDPIHLGVLIGINMSIGTITPPLGTVMYTVCAVGDLSVPRYLKAIYPYMLLLIASMFVMVFFPQVITFLPHSLGLR